MSNRIDNVLHAGAAGLLAAVLLGCSKPPEEPSDVPVPAAPTEVPAPEASPPETAPSPAPEAPPPTEPSAVPKPSARNEPALDSMHAAPPTSGKIGVPVDLRYVFDSTPQPDQPATLHLAAVPRIDGTNLTVSVDPAAGIQVGKGSAPLAVSKASVSGVYRQQFSVTRTAMGPLNLRVLVTLDLPEGRTFGFYSIPLVSGTTAQKQESVKQR